MTHLELAKKLGLTDILVCLLNEFGYSNQEIMEKMQITEPTIYNALKRFQPVSEGLKQVTDNRIDARNSDVQTVVDAFQKFYNPPSISKYDRFAASRLSKKWGGAAIAKIIEVLASKRDDKYAPKIHSISQLEQKWLAVEEYFHKLKEDVKVDL